MNCTKCHDHKYDPLSQRDYYKLRAFFEPHQVRLDPLPGATDLEQDGLPRVFDAHPDAATYLHIRGDDKNPDKSAPIEPGVPSLLAFDDWSVEQVSMPPEAYFPSLQSFVLEDHLGLAQLMIQNAQEDVEDARTVLKRALRKQQERDAQQPEPAAKEKAIAKKPAPPGAVFIQDDFSQPQPDVWETGPGEWKYEDGRLRQQKTGRARAWMRTRKQHPQDFIATLRFKTTGGDKWRSVGLAFDVTGEREKLVYLSAVNPGSKLNL